AGAVEDHFFCMSGRRQRAAERGPYQRESTERRRTTTVAANATYRIKHAEKPLKKISSGVRSASWQDLQIVILNQQFIK
ncbi:MAG: hypothetical protein Q7J32_15525, partial [Sphingomonadaceae bacterium]|nr:hypothetical protein [Sphingomonadaceae bacterium]